MLNISVVLYQSSKSDILRIIDTLENCDQLNNLFFIDNSQKENEYLKEISKNKINYIHTGKNLGYGRGHNIALRKSINSSVKYHLVLNPDIYFSVKILDEIIYFMNKNTDVGHLLPKAFNPSNKIEFNCRMLPTPFNLFARSFLPNFFYKISNDKYDLKYTGYNTIINAPQLSGSFMFMRVSALKEVGIFDERFFMYCEDVDLCRRIHRNFKTIFYPHVNIIHRHEKASYKSIKMKFIHIINAIKYFNKYGWFFDSERRLINKKVLKQYNIK
jgi:GT2 family glycosyltransferase